jgi:hypothetical protein
MHRGVESAVGLAQRRGDAQKRLADYMFFTASFKTPLSRLDVASLDEVRAFRASFETERFTKARVSLLRLQQKRRLCREFVLRRVE